MSSPWIDWLTGIGRHVLTGARDLVYPACCFLCERPLSSSPPHFCPVCLHALFTDPYPCCPRCAATIGPFALIDGRCRDCREESFAFERAMRLGPYEGLLREVILRLKHQTGEGLAERLAEHWADTSAARFAELAAEVIVPVPLHWMRRWRRGYNQSEALAQGLSARLGVPCQPALLRRVRNTPRQTSQTRDGRKANVRGAFQARRVTALAGKRVLLVDDVMTTGATVGEAARALRAGGPRSIAVAVLARAHG